MDVEVRLGFEEIQRVIYCGSIDEKKTIVVGVVVLDRYLRKVMLHH